MMRDEIQRISKLVAEGKLSPEDAADLIDAFYAAEKIEEESAPTPPPPPGAARDPFRTLIDQIEKLTKEGVDSVDWKEVSKQARDGARKGLDALRHGIEDISKGKLNINLFGTHEQKVVTLPLVVDAGKTLRIENAVGDVRVTGRSVDGAVTATAHFKGSSVEDARAKAAAYTLIVEESDHQVIIRQPDVSGLSVDLEIKVPGDVALDIRTQSGDVAVSDNGGSCRITGRSGDVHLERLTGLIEVTLESGDVNVVDSESPALAIENKSGDIRTEDFRGNMNVRTATGDLHIVRSSGKTIALESISGDIILDLLEPVTGSVNVRTVSGSVSAGVEDGGDCRVTLATLRGDVSCEIELQEEAKASQRITGKMGDGAGTLDISAVTGDVRLEQRKHETAEV
jgi:hypothetical protein